MVRPPQGATALSDGVLGSLALVSGPPEEPESGEPGRDEGGADPDETEAPLRGWIDPDDRLWRHPSEVAPGGGPTGQAGPVLSPPPKRGYRGPLMVSIAAAAVLAVGAFLAVLLSPASQPPPGLGPRRRLAHDHHHLRERGPHRRPERRQVDGPAPGQHPPRQRDARRHRRRRGRHGGHDRRPAERGAEHRHGRCRRQARAGLDRRHRRQLRRRARQRARGRARWHPSRTTRASPVVPPTWCSGTRPPGPAPSRCMPRPAR